MNEQERESRPIHYGWYVVAAGTLCIFAGLGFGRFALGMLLPSMGASLGLSFSQMGLISTSNFVGYLIAVLLCGKLSARFGARKLIGFALLLVGLSMLCIGASAKLFMIIVFYTLTGMGSGMSNVSMMALVSAWFTSRSRGKAAGFIVIGSGFAIVIAGRLVPWLNGKGGEGWRISWLVLGTIVTLVSAICYLILRDRPRELGLEPVGSSQASTPGQSRAIFEKEQVRPSLIYHCAAIYFLFGFTYVIYATFVVTVMVQERGFSEAVAGNFWSWVGFLSLFSGPVFGVMSDKFGRKAALITVFCIQAMAYLLIAVNLPGLFLYLSIGFYGIVAWSIPSIMAALIADYVGPHRTVSVFGFITFIFGIGQIAGPYLAGVLAETTGSFSSSFYLASGMAVLAAVLSAALPRESPALVSGGA
ncbi:MAG: MFS transporter [Proteobacteria bacterium]|nr:MFS transporter [Pseudomonadota bacterium]MBU4297563.1 MFS transporter [Pseudomonadota bacterium]MCG2749085.1 MFS transporter [Desulfobulbaceae bacterium]